MVEDDKSMNDILVGCLTDDNHEVSSAFSGPEAIELSKLNTYDLLITDVRLPGIDGVETIDRVKRLQPHNVSSLPDTPAKIRPFALSG